MGVIKRRLKLNYILNHYDPFASTHFAHVTGLLAELAVQGCAVNLFVEKTSGPLPQLPGVRVRALRLRAPLVRHIELFLRLCLASLAGYKSTFIRISAPAAIVASICHSVSGGRAYLWQSGTTREFDLGQKWGWSRVHWVVRSAIPNYLARKICQRFVTGPEPMVDYYADSVGIDRRKIRLLYNDIDLEKWGKGEGCEIDRNFLEYFGIPRPSHVMLLVHRLSPVRQTPVYLEKLFFDLKREFGLDWVIVIAGDGEEKSTITGLADAAGVGSCCRFLGPVPNRELPVLYGLADLFINPSRAEGFPRVIIEAMASGLPIVTTDAGGTSALLGRLQAGWVADKDVPGDFSRLVMELLRNPEVMAELARENLLQVARFSTPAVARMYMDVLGEQ